MPLAQNVIRKKFCVLQKKVLSFGPNRTGEVRPNQTFGRSLLQYTLDLRKPDLRKNLDLRKIVATTDFLVHKLFDLRKIF